MASRSSAPMHALPAVPSDQDYAMILAAVRETARGRWFLDEFAARNRHAETDRVMTALARLEGLMAKPVAAVVMPPAPSALPAGFTQELGAMADAIARTRAEIAALRPEGTSGRTADASDELDAIVAQTETATSEILAAAETIQEIAWTLRETGFEAEVCDVLDQKATEIYTACSFQDLTGQRTRKVIEALSFVERRVDGMMAIWGRGPALPEPAPAGERALLSGPARPGEGLDQSDVDVVMAVPGPRGPVADADSVEAAPWLEAARAEATGHGFSAGSDALDLAGDVQVIAFDGDGGDLAAGGEPAVMHEAVPERPEGDATLPSADPPPDLLPASADGADAEAVGMPAAADGPWSFDAGPDSGLADDAPEPLAPPMAASGEAFDPPPDEAATGTAGSGIDGLAPLPEEAAAGTVDTGHDTPAPLADEAVIADAAAPAAPAGDAPPAEAAAVAGGSAGDAVAPADRPPAATVASPAAGRLFERVAPPRPLPPRAEPAPPGAIERLAAERLAAERIAAERLAAERLAAERPNPPRIVLGPPRDPKPAPALRPPAPPAEDPLAVLDRLSPEERLALFA